MRRVLCLVAIALAAVAWAAPPEWATNIGGSFLGLRTWQWVGMGALLVICFLVGLAGRFIAIHLLRLRERKGGGPTSPTGSRSIRRGVSLLTFVVPYYLLIGQLELSESLAYKLSITFETLTVLGIVLLIYGIWDAICDALIHRAGSYRNAEKLLIPVTRKLVRFFILVGGLILALGVFGVNITGLLAGVGLGGLVVALAAKDSVENVFGSLTILFDMPFALGDWVKIDKAEGIVEEINLRSTKIRTFEDSMITLPNSNLIKAAVENYGARRYRRQRFYVRVSNANKSENLTRFLEAIRTYLAGVKEIVTERTVVEVNELTEASTGILVQCFVEAGNFQEEAAVRGRLILAIFQAAEETKTSLVATPLPNPDAEAEKKEEAAEEEAAEEKRKEDEEEDDII